MRMDIFNTLTNEARQNAVSQFVMVYGVDEITEVNADNLHWAMKTFPCALYEDGSIGPAEDCNTLGDLLGDCIVNPSAENMDAFRKALENANKWLDGWTRPECRTSAFDYICEAMDTFGIVFDDWGNIAYV